MRTAPRRRRADRARPCFLLRAAPALSEHRIHLVARQGLDGRGLPARCHHRWLGPVPQEPLLPPHAPRPRTFAAAARHRRGGGISYHGRPQGIGHDRLHRLCQQLRSRAPARHGRLLVDRPAGRFCQIRDQCPDRDPAHLRGGLQIGAARRHRQERAVDLCRQGRRVAGAARPGQARRRRDHPGRPGVRGSPRLDPACRGARAAGLHFVAQRPISTRWRGPSPMPAARF